MKLLLYFFCGEITEKKSPFMLMRRNVWDIKVIVIFLSYLLAPRLHLSLCVPLSCSVGHILFYCTPYVIWLSRAQLTKWLPGRRMILTLNLRREGNTEWADGQWREGAVEGAERGEGKLELTRKEVSSWEMEYITKGEPRHKVSSPSFQYSLWTF